MEAAATFRARSLLPAPPRLLLLLLMVAAALVSPSAAANTTSPRATALFVFGDSTVDAGNNNFVPTLARGNFPPYGRDFPGGRATGRFCNGRLATDFFSEALGLGRGFVPAYLDPSYSIRDFATGACFASAGSGIDVETGAALRVIPLPKQVDMFREYKARLEQHLGAAEAGMVVSGAVYVVSIGSNDLLENYFSMLTPRFLQFRLPQYIAYLMGLTRAFVSDMYALGARRIGLAEVSVVGCVPVNRARLGGWCDEVHNAAARGFNAALKDMLAGLRPQLPGSDLRVAEMYDFFDDILRAPARYGFTRVDVGCCGSGRFEMGFTCSALDPRTCPDASKYVFWDAVHTTEQANRIVAEHLFNTTFGAFS